MEVAKKIEALLDEALARRKFLELHFCATDGMDSPIERLLYAAFQSCEIDSPHLLKVKMRNFSCKMPLDLISRMKLNTFDTYGVSIFPQIQVGRYRVDFLAAANALGKSADRHYLAIECDGHDFHERTKEQAAHDKARDRCLLQHQIPVMRFAGSEVWANPIACVNQVLDYFQRLVVPPLPEMPQSAVETQ